MFFLVTIVNSAKLPNSLLLSKKRLLIITPHLSTGGAPQVTLNKISLLRDDYDIKCVEYHNISETFVVQKKKIIELIGSENLHTLVLDGEKKILEIIKDFQPHIISMEEFPEFFMEDSITESIYSKDRPYKIFETTHDSSFQTKNKKWFPDKFIFVSPYSAFKFIPFNIPYEIIEYPVDRKEKNKDECQKKLGLDSDWKHVINVGLFTPRKNQKYIFDIAQKMKDHKIMFHFIGNLAGNFQHYWEPLMNNKPENCVVWGERDDVESFIQASDLSLFASRGDKNNKELNPIAIKETLEYNTPLLMFNLDVYCGKYNNRHNIHFLSGNIDRDVEKISEILSLTKKNDKSELILIGTYPDTNERKRLTLECIRSYKSVGRKIMLLSHYPVSEEIQKEVDYYIYDKNNPLTYHSYYSLFYNQTSNYEVNINLNNMETSNQSLTVYVNLMNGFKMAKNLGFEKVFYTTFDVLLDPMDVETISQGFKKLTHYNAYLSNIPNPLGMGVETTAMWFKTDFFLSKFKDVKTPEEYNKLCLEYDAYNFLEHFMFKVLENEPSVHIVNIDGHTMLKNSGRGVSSNSEYYCILPIQGTNNGYIFYFYTYNIDDRIINLSIKDMGVEKFNDTFKISETNEYFKDLNYKGSPLELTITFYDCDGIIKKESMIIDEDSIGRYQKNGTFSRKGI